MSLIRSDNLELRVPKPTRTTDVLGVRFENTYPDLASIPGNMKYLWLKVTAADGREWRLENPNDLNEWTEVTGAQYTEGENTTDGVARFYNPFGIWVNSPTTPVTTLPIVINKTNAKNTAVCGIYYKGSVISRGSSSGGNINEFKGENQVDQNCIIFLIYNKANDLFNVNIQAATIETQLATPALSEIHGEATATLTWDNISDATSYEITGGGSTSLINNGNGTHSFVITGLSANTQYTLNVRATASGFIASDYGSITFTTVAGATENPPTNISLSQSPIGGTTENPPTNINLSQETI